MIFCAYQGNKKGAVATPIPALALAASTSAPGATRVRWLLATTSGLGRERAAGRGLRAAGEAAAPRRRTFAGCPLEARGARGGGAGHDRPARARWLGRRGPHGTAPRPPGHAAAAAGRRARAAARIAPGGTPLLGHGAGLARRPTQYAAALGSMRAYPGLAASCPVGWRARAAW
eukprot:scaffold19867_cov56-Phaeocystis_antarctica.AAC.3